MRDTPSFTCIAMSLERALNALDGEPVGAEAALAPLGLVARRPVAPSGHADEAKGVVSRRIDRPQPSGRGSRSSCAPTRCWRS